MATCVAGVVYRRHAVCQPLLQDLPMRFLFFGKMVENTVIKKIVNENKENQNEKTT